MRSRHRWGFSAVALGLLVGSRAAGADLPPPPDPPEGKRVPATIEVDFGVFADRVSKKHTVAAGETLRAIAAKELGDAKRWKAIADANADVAKDPDHIVVGAVLWLPSARSFEPAPPTVPGPAVPPPSDPAAAPPAKTALAPWYDAFWLEPTGRRQLSAVARATPGEIPGKFRASGAIAFVPHAPALGVVAALASGPVATTDPALRDAPTAWFGTDTLVHREDPTVRIVARYKLTGVEGARVAADEDRVRYDADRHVVTKTWTVRPPAYTYEKEAPGDAKPPGSKPDASKPDDSNPSMAGGDAAVPPSALGAPPSSPPGSVSRWPASTGLLVASAGIALVAGLWFAQSRRRPRGTPPSPPA